MILDFYGLFGDQHMPLFEEVALFSHRLGLNETDGTILQAIAWFNPLMIPTHEELASKLGMSKRTVSGAFGKFKSLGLVERTDDGYDLRGLHKALAALEPDVRKRALQGMIHTALCSCTEND